MAEIGPEYIYLCQQYVQNRTRARQLREFIEKQERDIEELDQEIEREMAELRRLDTEGYSLTDITGETPAMNRRARCLTI